MRSASVVGQFGGELGLPPVMSQPGLAPSVLTDFLLPLLGTNTVEIEGMLA